MTLLPGNPVDYKWDTIGIVIKNAVQITMDIAGGIAAIYILIGAIQYLTAFGDEAKATAAKNTILYAVIGVVVIVLAKLIIGLVWSFVTKSTPTF